MPVRKDIPGREGLYFITFTCYKWLPLIAETNGYDLVYKWFNYLEGRGNRVAGSVIMPNHVHVLIEFSVSGKRINKIVGDGKRFIGYGLIERLKKKKAAVILAKLQKAVAPGEARKGKLHAVWEESFDWKLCETLEFAWQKLVYMHNNPCSGKWNLARDISAYPHSSASYYIRGRHSMHEVTDVEKIFFEMGATVSEAGKLDFNQ